jgi:hypothetical protein
MHESDAIRWGEAEVNIYAKQWMNEVSIYEGYNFEKCVDSSNI